MRRAAFIVSDCGFGHRVRCEALADELRARGWECVASTPYGWCVADVLVIDEPRPGPALPVKASKVVCIVDTLIAETTADLLIQGHELLRPEFRAVSWGDHGFSSSHDIFDLRTVARESAESLAHTLAASRVAITWGGMRANECACVGTPMVLIPRNEGERLNAARLVKAGAAVVAEEDEAGSMARGLLNSPATLRAMSKAGRKAVDGLGVKRAADAIEALVT